LDALKRSYASGTLRVSYAFSDQVNCYRGGIVAE
jgi:hypothetical protein